MVSPSPFLHSRVNGHPPLRSATALAFSHFWWITEIGVKLAQRFADAMVNMPAKSAWYARCALGGTMLVLQSRPVRLAHNRQIIPEAHRRIAPRECAGH